MTSMDSLCDNTLAHTLSFLDFHSAVTVSKFTSKALTFRVEANRHVLWKEIFHRHCFAPPQQPSTNDEPHEYLEECQNRRRLFQNLVGGRKQHNKSSSFNLPNRYFYFVPVTPPDTRVQQQQDDNHDWDDVAPPPPVDFDCPSFVLTNPGTSGELVFLNPFDGSLVVQTSCLDNAVASDEAMMEQAMTDTATAIIKHKHTLGLKNIDEEHLAGAVIDESVFRNHNMGYYQQEPAAVLMDLDDYYNTDLSDYFILSRNNNNNHDHHRAARAAAVGTTDDHRVAAFLGEDAEVEIDLIGVESKAIIQENGKVIGTMVAVGRAFCSEGAISTTWGSGNPKVVSELIIWKRDHHAAQGGGGGGGGDFLDQRFVCRVRSSYKTMEMDPVFHRIYFSFPFREGPFRRFDADIRADDNTTDDHFDGGSRVVAVYPMESYLNDEEETTTGPKHFPKPEFILKCNHPVCAIVVAPGGKNVLTATTKGTVEFWETGEVGSGARRTSIIAVKACLNKKIVTMNAITESEEVLSQEAATVDQPTTTTMHGGPPPTTAAAQGDADERMEEDGQANANAESTISPVVTSFHFPHHYSLDRCGFVTLHHVHGQGSWLLLWRKEHVTCNFEIASSITIPLSARRKPCIHYDGRRLLIFGQDHIGMIILVYHVLNSWEDLGAFENTNKGVCKGDESAGVRNLTDPPRVKFSNRIRHAALGGMQYYDAVYMTANERFVVVNTKTGNLLGGGSTPGTDGLLVIDLEE